MSERKKYMRLPAILSYPERLAPIPAPKPTKRVDFPQKDGTVLVYTLPDKARKNPEIKDNKEIYNYKFKRTMSVHDPGRKL